MALELISLRCSGTWNVRILCSSGSFKTIARKLAKYKLGFVGLQEVRWDKGGTEPADDCTFFLQK
jgi:hypothetical protein